MLEFLPNWMPPTLLASAAVLGLVFRRMRTFWVALLLLAGLWAIQTAQNGGNPGVGGPTRLREAVQGLLPWLVMLAALWPEASLRSLRTLGLLTVFGVALWFTLALPEPRWITLVGALHGGPWWGGRIDSAWIALIAAAMVGLVRWVLRGAPMDAGLALGMLAALPAFAPGAGAELRAAALAAAGMTLLVALVYASYRMAFIDALTGLPNRRALDETLSRLGSHFALAMTDVDHFKKFNDSYGHDAGDVVLQAVARRLRRTRGAAAYRYGGEEFCLVFEGRHVGRAEDACEAVRAQIEAERLRIRKGPGKRKAQAVRRNEAVEVGVTLSLGLARRTPERKTAAEVIKAADQALYKAKGKGRNRVVCA